MHFASDNWAGAAPEIAAAIADEATRAGPAYGNSERDAAVTRRFAEIFEREVAVFFVATGSAANALALASVNRVGGAVFCHRESHVSEDECGGVEFLTGGARLRLVGGEAGLMDPHALEAAIARFPLGFVHAGQPMAVTLTQASEAGTVYSLELLARLAAIAHGAGLPVHMDGARFANALVALGCTPAEMTWKAGIDLLSFGGTKNGCVAAEAIVVMDPAKSGELTYLRKRAGQLFSKSRFIAAQFDAYFEDGLWLRLATHANAMADRLRAGIAATPTMRLAWTSQANEVFAVMNTSDAERLRAAGAVFYDWATPHGIVLGAGEGIVRLVTSFATTSDEVAALVELLGQ